MIGTASLEPYRDLDSQRDYEEPNTAADDCWSQAYGEEHPPSLPKEDCTSSDPHNQVFPDIHAIILTSEPLDPLQRRIFWHSFDQLMDVQLAPEENLADFAARL